MSNALGTLFGDIANAIREKSGETGTMKPAEFPAKISAIETGGGDVASAWMYKKGEFTPTATQATVEHGMGVIPDMICVFASSAISADNIVMAVIGFSEAAIAAMPEGTNPCMIIRNSTYWSYSFPITDESASEYGPISKTNTETFTVGGSGAHYHLSTQIKYQWIAVANIFA